MIYFRLAFSWIACSGLSLLAVSAPSPISSLPLSTAASRIHATVASKSLTLAVQDTVAEDPSLSSSSPSASAESRSDRSSDASNAEPSAKPSRRIPRSPSRSGAATKSPRHETGYRGTSLGDEPPKTARVAKLFRNSSPVNRDELKMLQERIRELTPKIIPVTVAIIVGRANGSGVIIDADGHVLTAAHVAGEPGRGASIYLADGRVLHGVTLGMNQRLDAGLIKITDKGEWPYASLGKSSDLSDGQWCLATGHPGGYDIYRPRPPVLRWGRVLKTDETAVLTDCTLVGGDSGGPLFDLQGNVIGIHSRIGKNLTINVHVPIDPYVESWDRLVKGETWGLLAEQVAWMGVHHEREAEGATIREVSPGSPAAIAGIQAGDRILKFNEMPIATFNDLLQIVRQSAIGETVRVELLRGGHQLELEITLGESPHVAP